MYVGHFYYDFTKKKKGLNRHHHAGEFLEHSASKYRLYQSASSSPPRTDDHMKAVAILGGSERTKRNSHNVCASFSRVEPSEPTL